jgi:AraC-like DNA-binding protein
MKQIPTGLHLFDPRRGDLSLKVERVHDGSHFAQPQRCNFFTMLLMKEGAGTFHTDSAEGRFTSPVLLFFNPYQTFWLRWKTPLQITLVQFHANFFCIETHHQAVGCNGVLFNDVYGGPGVGLTPAVAQEFDELVEQMEHELHASGVAHGEILVALLKVLLVKATRLKLQQKAAEQPGPDQAPPRMPQVLESLAELIETRFKKWHAPADYAAALHITPKALGKLVKARFGRTLTDLIRERLLNHAKWQLLHTTRSVKEIAWDAGFADELYFSRLFKRATGLAPTAFREFETEIRAGSNLSMYQRLPSMAGARGGERD